jgi:molybdate transport system substrate-binding protein
VLNSTIRKLAVALSAAFMMSHAPANAQTLKVAAAPNFANTANELLGAFAAYYSIVFNTSYSAGLVVKSDASIQADIIAGGTTGSYDLYLASSPEAIATLAINLANAGQTGVISSTFIYAEDALELYSPSVDVTGGLPYPLTTNFVMPDPTSDNYGVAAALLLALGPWHILPTNIPGGYVNVGGSVGTTYAAITAGTYPYGFVGRSQVCQYSNGVYTYPAGSYHHEYSSAIEQAPLLLTAVTLASSTRTTAQNTALANLVAFIQGAADSNGNTTAIGQNVIQSYCFGLP